MKKLASFLLVLCLVLCAAASAESADFAGLSVPDFTVTTTDGDEIALSRLLEEKDLVVLNIFTSWCPPCRQEFPEMDSVYRSLSDRMEIVALSAEPTDTLDIIRDYKAGLGLSFPMGLTAGTDLVQFARVQGYPTTLFVDQRGVVGYYQLGSFLLAEQFQGVADYFLSDAYDGTPAASYNVYVCDEDGNPLPGVSINFCTDTLCALHTSSENGAITFAGAPENYHLQVLKAPEGYSVDPDFDAWCDGSGDWVIVQLTKD